MTILPTLSSAEEAQRLAVLERYEILDTPPDGAFDRLTQTVARIFNMPIAIISLVDEDRIWFKSHYGVDVQQISRDPGLCASAAFSEGVYVVEDARKDPRTLTNPLVAGSFGLQFYAAVPLKTSEGYSLGTLCVLDKKKRYLNQEQTALLEGLGAIVMELLDTRLSARLAVRAANQRARQAEERLQQVQASVA